MQRHAGFHTKITSHRTAAGFSPDHLFLDDIQLHRLASSFGKKNKWLLLLRPGRRKLSQAFAGNGHSVASHSSAELTAMVRMTSTGLDIMDWISSPEPMTPEQLPEALLVDAMDWQWTVDVQLATCHGCCAME